MEYFAYLDIETTGLNPRSSDLTVVGIYRENGSSSGFVQLVGEDISESRIMEAMENVSVLYTYNGSRFDLPFIQAKLGIDLAVLCRHRDLMYSCWKKKLYGGLKGVERQLGIERTLPDVNGLVAVELWQKYKNQGDENALEKLLKYNEEDVKNLSALRQHLTR